MLSPGDILDGYTLIRRIGQGGFGEVWLCRSDSMGDFRALKFIPSANGSALDKEYEALVRYRKAAAQLRSPHLTPIEHVNRCAGGLFYIMPLADGAGAASPESPGWSPYTLGTYIEAKRAEPAWFTSGEVIAVMQPALRGLQCLADAGLVHRDIKPDNILFFGGKACLGDISLMTDDRTRITRHGTPGYSTPSWFTGGHHDMYGAAAVLYTLLTGNDPDRMGRSAYIWPPQGESSLSASQRIEWLRLHAVIRRATDEKTSERYADFDAMAAGLTGEVEARVSSPTAGNRAVMVARIGLVFGLAGMATWNFHFGGVAIPGIAIACACYSLSVAKKTAIATILLGIIGILLVMCNLGMEALTIYDQEIRERIEKSAATKKSAAAPSVDLNGAAHESEYAALLEKDSQNTERFRQKWTTRIREISTGVGIVSGKISAALQAPAESDAFKAEINGIRDSLESLKTAHPKTGIDLYNEAADFSRGIEKTAASIPTNADEEFVFRQKIRPMFAEHAKGGSLLAQISSATRAARDNPAIPLQSAMPDNIRRLAERVETAKTAGALDEARYTEITKTLIECSSLLVELQQKATGV